jgi:hypothetical protein
MRLMPSHEGCRLPHPVHREAEIRAAQASIEEALVDFCTRYKAVNVDYVRAGDLDRLQLLILNEEILAFADLVAAGLFMGLDDFTRRGWPTCHRA